MIKFKNKKNLNDILINLNKNIEISNENQKNIITYLNYYKHKFYNTSFDTEPQFNMDCKVKDIDEVIIDIEDLFS